MKPAWSWWMIFFDVLWIHFVNVLLRVFTFMLIMDVSLYFYYLVFLSDFGNKVILATQNEFRRFSAFLILWKFFRRIDFFFFFGRIGLWTPGLMLARQVLYHLSILGYFWDKFSLFAWGGLEPWSSWSLPPE
jgi:hypothetical protein